MIDCDSNTTWDFDVNLLMHDLIYKVLDSTSITKKDTNYNEKSKTVMRAIQSFLELEGIPSRLMVMNHTPSNSDTGWFLDCGGCFWSPMGVDMAVKTAQYAGLDPNPENFNFVEHEHQGFLNKKETEILSKIKSFLRKPFEFEKAVFLHHVKLENQKSNKGASYNQVVFEYNANIFEQQQQHLLKLKETNKKKYSSVNLDTLSLLKTTSSNSIQLLLEARVEEFLQGNEVDLKWHDSASTKSKFLRSINAHLDFYKDRIEQIFTNTDNQNYLIINTINGSFQKIHIDRSSIKKEKLFFEFLSSHLLSHLTKRWGLEYSPESDAEPSYTVSDNTFWIAPPNGILNPKSPTQSFAKAINRELLTKNIEEIISYMSIFKTKPELGHILKMELEHSIKQDLNSTVPNSTLKKPKNRF